MAPQFTYRGPRFNDLGPNSGEEFRDDYLIPCLLESESKEAVIDFAGTQMFSPSFLEEAFCGAVLKGCGEKIRHIRFLNVTAMWSRCHPPGLSAEMRTIENIELHYRPAIAGL
ncbi:MAG TPA: STAS-like domain-containing protein [Sphaerochaeta sp.]|nr:STAS-like domain-containing protein [Sphaerochaeta sp.]